MASIETFRRSSMVVNSRRPMPLPYQPRSIVITAKRGNPGSERAQVTNGQAANPAKTAPGSIAITPNQVAPAQPPRPSAGQVAELMRQIRLAEAQGRPADALRKQLFDTIENMKP